MAETLVQQLMGKLANRRGIDFGEQAIKDTGPYGAMYTIDRLRRTGLPEGLSKEDAAIADRYAEGRNFRERYGSILGPAAATVGAVGYEGAVKPIINSLPTAVSQYLPEGFRPSEVTSPAGGDEAMLRALAMILGSTSTTEKQR